eukprot:7529239-Pyramimonas_sp.AAC.1
MVCRRTSINSRDRSNPQRIFCSGPESDLHCRLVTLEGVWRRSEGDRDPLHRSLTPLLALSLSPSLGEQWVEHVLRHAIQLVREEPQQPGGRNHGGQPAEALVETGRRVHLRGGESTPDTRRFTPPTYGRSPHREPRTTPQRPL